MSAHFARYPAGLSPGGVYRPADRGSGFVGRYRCAGCRLSIQGRDYECRLFGTYVVRGGSRTDSDSRGHRAGKGEYRMPKTLCSDELERQEKYLAELPPDFTFPLFNTKRALDSQRQNGYRNTAVAAREIVDNALEAKATKVHVIFETAVIHSTGGFVRGFH